LLIDNNGTTARPRPTTVAVQEVSYHQPLPKHDAANKSRPAKPGHSGVDVANKTDNCCCVVVGVVLVVVC
jgi:hypothetical protein